MALQQAQMAVAGQPARRGRSGAPPALRIAIPDHNGDASSSCSSCTSYPSGLVVGEGCSSSASNYYSSAGGGGGGGVITTLSIPGPRMWPGDPPPSPPGGPRPPLNPGPVAPPTPPHIHHHHQHHQLQHDTRMTDDWRVPDHSSSLLRKPRLFQEF